MTPPVRNLQHLAWSDPLGETGDPLEGPSRPSPNFFLRKFLPSAGPCLHAPAPALFRPPPRIDFTQIKPADFFDQVLPRVTDGDIFIEIPLRPGIYNAGKDSWILMPRFKVGKGKATAQIKFKEGRLTEFRVTFDPPFEVDPNIRVPILSPLLDCIFSGKILGAHLDVGKGKILGDTKKIVTTLDLTEAFLKFLKMPERKTLPLSVVELAKTFKKLAESGGLKPTGPLSPMDFPNTKIHWAKIRLKTGPLEVGPLKVQIDAGKDGQGNVFGVANSSLQELRLLPVHFGGVELKGSDGKIVAKAGPLDLRGIRWRPGAPYSLPPFAGSVGGISLDLGTGKVDLAQGLSWTALGLGFDPVKKTGSFQIAGLKVPRLSGKIGNGEVEWDLGSIAGDLSVQRLMEQGKGRWKVSLQKAGLELLGGSLARPTGTAQFDASSIRDLHINFMLNDGAVAPEELRAGFTSPVFKVKGGSVDLGGAGPSYQVKILPSVLKDARFNMEGDEVVASGAPDLNLSEMLVQFGQGMNLPLETDVRLKKSRITGRLQEAKVGNIFGKVPGGVTLTVGGELDFSGEGSGWVASYAPLNQFKLHSPALKVGSHFRRLHFSGGKMRKVSAEDTEIGLDQLSGKVAAFTIFETQVEKDSEARVFLGDVEVNLEKYLREKEETAVPLTLATITGFNLDLFAHSHKNRIHLNPKQHEHGGDQHLVSRSVETRVEQKDNRAEIVYDPKDKKSKLLFKGGNLRIRMKSHGTEIQR